MQKDVTDRKYFSKSDRSFQLMNIYAKLKILSFVISKTLGLLIVLYRKGIKKNKDGSLVIIGFLRIGDTVFTIPAVKTIISLYPFKKVWILCYPESEAIFRLSLERNIEIVTVAKDDFYFGRRIGKKTVRKLLSSLDPAIIFDLTGSILSASLLFNSKAAEIYGQNINDLRNIYNGFSLKRKTPHLIDMYLDNVSLARNFKRDPELYEHKVHFNPSGYILIHPLAIRKSKEWNLNKYLKLYEDISKQYETFFLLPSLSIDQDITLEIIQKGVKIKFTSDISELIEVIRGCSLYISNDTGPLYIANLMGKPTFTIYGPTNPDYSLPFGRNHHFVRKKLGCTPDTEQACFTMAGINCTHYDCMNLLELPEVKTEIFKLIETLGILKSDPQLHRDQSNSFLVI
jgi:heptosyltransferase II